MSNKITRFFLFCKFDVIFMTIICTGKLHGVLYEGSENRVQGPENRELRVGEGDKDLFSVF